MKKPAHLLLAAPAAICLNVGMQAADEFQSMDGPARLALARARHGASARELCTQAGLAYPPHMVFLRAFKHQGELELWGADADRPMRLLKTYEILAPSGGLGPKRRQGDAQVPEGCYRVAVFNPLSRFHLSLGLDYPNASDRVRSDRDKPGGEIYIHGNSVSIGCLPIGDAAIEELYIIGVDTRAQGSRAIPVHIFPARMSGESWDELKTTHAEHAAFWSELQPIYDAFERTKRVPDVEVAPNGRYVLPSRH